MLLLACTLGLVAGAARAECPPVDRCEQLWIAAQDAGVPLSFFSQVQPPSDANDIDIGESLVSAHNMNVRRAAGDFSLSLGLLPRGTMVLVEDHKRVSVPGKGTQLWLRVSVQTDAIRPSGTPLRASGGGVPHLSEGEDRGAYQSLGPVAKKVVDCFSAQAAGGRQATIRGVHDCSGFWVTPRALLACSLGAKCPALADTPEGRAIFAAQNIGEASILSLVAKTLPRLPSSDDITACKKRSGTEAEFSKCSAELLYDKYGAQIECFKKFTDGEKLACFTQQAGNKDFTALVGCLAGGRPSPDKVALCTTSKDIEQRVSAMRDCVAAAAGGNAAVTCVTTQLSPSQREVVGCLRTSSDTLQSSSCFDAVLPEGRKVRQVATCLAAGSDQTVAQGCLLQAVGGGAPLIAQCLASPSKIDSAVCLLGDSPQVQTALRMQRCLSGGRDVSAVLNNCSDGILDVKTRENMACITRSGGSRAQLAACAAGAILPPEAARLVGCASSSSGPTSFAVCAAGPSMNEEWRIAAECAVESGSVPVTFAVCTAGGLTVRELTKCFGGEVGKDCFGPNNTVAVGLKDTLHDLTQGPGENNEVVKAVREFGTLVGGPNSVINKPGQIWGGPNSVFNNPGQILGGDHSVFRDPGQALDPGRWRF